MPTAGPSQRTRFAPSRLSTVWSTVISHLTPPSHPSTTSESAHDSSFNHTDLYYTDSVAPHHLPVELLSTQTSRKRGPLSRLSRRKGAKSSQANSTSRYGDDEDPNVSVEPVSHLVVENDFDHFIPAAAKSDSGSTNRTPGRSQTTHPASYSKSDDDEPGLITDGGKSEGQSLSQEAKTWIQSTIVYEFIVDRGWPTIKHFFDSSYHEPAKERGFQKEAWFSQKQGTLLSAAYFLISWALTTGLLPLPLTVFNWWSYFGLGATFILPIPLFVLFDIPRRHNWVWQFWLFGATWILSDILIGEMYQCGFFNKTKNTCGSRSFINFLGYAYGLPTLAILAMRQNRLMAGLGAVQWMVLCGVLLVNQGGAPKLFFRNLASFALYHAFLIGTSFLKERSDRQIFALRQQLKIQYRATQSAQVMERRAADSKKRFVSYIFHEVRVPLNTALLAVQNLEGENVFRGLHSDQAEMVHGLMGSLTMMEKVLNDVLSFNRMESGKFAQARKPFEFHKSIQLVALSHRVQAQMAGIDLIVDLDRDIDKIGGTFVGDEMRLRQVASNLVSNSIKFTDEGSVRIVTKLLYPRFEPTPGVEIDDPIQQAEQTALEMERASRMERLATGTTISSDLEKGSVGIDEHRDSAARKEEEERKKRKAVVRVEIHDTGVGLRKADIVDNRLFSPYVQTEIGRRQGGKGSGLGLALVRQIVKLSNGRLGVESEYGKGSMFWFELPYSIPPIKGRSKEGPHELIPSLSPGIPPRMTPPLQITIQLPLGRIPEGASEDDVGRTRPPLAMTDSTMPLLPEAHGQTRSPPPETPGFFHAPDPSPGSSTLVGQETNPFNASSAEVPQAAPLAMATPLEPPLCCFVVDDDKLTRMLMSRMLSRLGHHVMTAENGKIALDMIRDSFEQKPNAPRFDIVFLDNQMPLMTGVEVAREVREMGCPLYIVGCTGNALREDQDEYIAAGADGIIPKPIHQGTVLDMIKEARRRIAGETAPRYLDTDDVPGTHSAVLVGLQLPQ